MPSKSSPTTRSVKLLVAAMRCHIRQSGKSLRAIESDLAWGHGTLSNILRGRTEIRLHHLESLARILGLKPIDLLREVYDDATGDEVTVTLPEERLSTLIRKAVTSALEGPPEALQSGAVFACPSCSQPLPSLRPLQDLRRGTAG
jgi:transcriptional regulator with XRE-family HTH domain